MARVWAQARVYPRLRVTRWGFQYVLRLIGKRASLRRMLRRLSQNLGCSQILPIGLAAGFSRKRNIWIDRVRLEAFPSRRGSDLEAFNECHVTDRTLRYLKADAVRRDPRRDEDGWQP